FDTIIKRRPELLYTCKKLKKSYEGFFETHRDDDKHFYLCIGDINVHRPFGIGGEPVDPKGVVIPPYLPDKEIVREDLSQFYGAIQGVDACIGNILKKLEDLGLRENTLFIYTTDHGEAYPRAKCTLYDPGLKTLLLMSWPSSDILQRNKVYNQMVSNIDLLPTLLDLIGAKIPKNIEGRSFLPLLKGEIDVFRKEIYTEKSFHEYYDPIRSIRTEEFKFIINFEKSETLYQLGMDMQQDALGKYMLKFINKPRPNEELYDLKNDPNEMYNLIDNPNYKDVVKNLKGKLYEWMKRTNDPILKGKIKYLPQVPPMRF
ncbi:MAG: sulfatase/phosphatase domain-containing protein, partial [Promethearchaeota archaeon]